MDIFQTINIYHLHTIIQNILEYQFILLNKGKLFAINDNWGLYTCPNHKYSFLGLGEIVFLKRRPPLVKHAFKEINIRYIIPLKTVEPINFDYFVILTLIGNKVRPLYFPKVF